MKRVRIGTRTSRLAVAQTQLVSNALKGSCEGLAVEIVPIVTQGDRTDKQLAEIGGKGLFTSELEGALRAGRIDLAVHSAKDVPTDMPGQFAIAAVPGRADPADALVSVSGGGVQDLPAGANVGTSSLRRRSQLLALRDDLEVVPIRGNVETRLRRVLDPGERLRLDAVVLAVAGLARSGLADQWRANICRLDVEQFIPAPAQGALLVQCLAGSDAIGVAGRIDDPAAHQAVLAERSVLRQLSADCHSCVAVHIFPAGDAWRGIAMAARSDGTGRIYSAASGLGAEDIADQIASRLEHQGAAGLLGS